MKAEKLHLLLSPTLVDCCRRALEAWGVDAQMFMMMEEAGELITALAQLRRGRVEEDAVIDEVADALVVALQMREMIGPEKVDARLHKKVKRLQKRLKKAGAKLTMNDEAAELWGLAHTQWPKG